MGRRMLRGGDPCNFNSGTNDDNVRFCRGRIETKFIPIVEIDGEFKFKLRLRAAMVELASSELGHPLSPGEINHLESHLPEIFHALCAPDHLPYSEMIYKAIEALDEEGGSSRDCISQYIKCHYGDLPWAHQRIVSHHLEKLQKSGEIVINPNGLYSFPESLKTPELLLEYPGSAMGVTYPDANPFAIVVKDDAETKKPARKRGRPPKPKPGSDKVVMGQRQWIEGKTEEIAVVAKQENARGRKRPRKLKISEEMAEVEVTQPPERQSGRASGPKSNRENNKAVILVAGMGQSQEFEGGTEEVAMEPKQAKRRASERLRKRQSRERIVDVEVKEVDHREAKPPK